jgi:hypothetical protein
MDYTTGGFKELVWKPIDLARGLRLYQVVIRYPAEKGQARGETKTEIVAARSPSHAAELVKRGYADVEWRPGHEPTITGFALNVLQPKSFHEGE